MESPWSPPDSKTFSSTFELCMHMVCIYLLEYYANCWKISVSFLPLHSNTSKPFPSSWVYPYVFSFQSCLSPFIAPRRQWHNHHHTHTLCTAATSDKHFFLFYFEVVPTSTTVTHFMVIKHSIYIRFIGLFWEKDTFLPSVLERMYMYLTHISINYPFIF